MREGWEYIPFEEVCVSMIKGPFGSDIKKSLYVPKSNDTYKVYIQVNAIAKDTTLGDYYISKEYFDSRMSRFEVKPDDYIITCDGTLGKYVRLPQDMERGIISASLLRVTLNNRALPAFFEYLWDGYILERLTSDIRNSALVHLPSATKIGKVVVPIPPLPEQQRIVSELDLLSSIIDKQKAQLKELDKLAQSIFYDMFGDPVENEKGWEVKKLGDIAIVKTGPFGSLLHKEDYITGGIPLINPIHMKDYAVIVDNNFTISKEKACELEDYLLRENDVIFARRGDIGRCAAVSDKEEGYLCGTGSLFVRFIEEINSVFVLYTVKEESFKQLLISKAKGATMLNLNSNIIAGLFFAFPPLPLQQQFAEKIQAIESQKASISQSIAETQKLFDYTMDKYFG